MRLQNILTWLFSIIIGILYLLINGLIVLNLEAVDIGIIYDQSFSPQFLTGKQTSIFHIILILLINLLVLYPFIRSLQKKSPNIKIVFFGLGMSFTIFVSLIISSIFGSDISNHYEFPLVQTLEKLFLAAVNENNFIIASVLISISAIQIYRIFNKDKNKEILNN